MGGESIKLSHFKDKYDSQFQQTRFTRTKLELAVVLFSYSGDMIKKYRNKSCANSPLTK